MIIGIDFDNTIASYDDIFYRTALKNGLIDQWVEPVKKQIRDAVREQYDDTAWQHLQGAVYGPLMGRAKLFTGVRRFLSRCVDEKIPFVIVSHKTEYARYDASRTNLRIAALAWLENEGLLGVRGSIRSASQIYFESTREKKIARIHSLHCTHFIDDLEEVLLDKSMGEKISKYLFVSGGEFESENLIVCRNWGEISERVFAK